MLRAQLREVKSSHYFEILRALGGIPAIMAWPRTVRIADLRFVIAD
jgi:hypothetical protein